MQYTQYTDVNAFYKATGDILLRHETQNYIPLGNILIGVSGEDITDWRDPADWYMATVSDERGIVLTAIMTPPFNVAICATDNRHDPNAITCLIESMAQNGITIPGVLAEKSLAELFTSMYTARYNLPSRIKMALRMYELTAVNPTVPKAPLRLAQERDMAFLPYWDTSFMHESLDRPFAIKDDPEGYRHIIRKGRTYIMEDKGIPVSTARITRDLHNICVIAAVYTPPYFRKKGYATACVAALSQIALNRGFNKVALTTDLSNPTANSIYQKIGYSPVCDSLEIVFG